MKLPEISRFRPKEPVAANSPTEAVISAVYGLAELLCRELDRSCAGRLRRRSLELLADAVLYGVQGMKQMGVDPSILRGSVEAHEIAEAKDAYEQIGSLQNDSDLFAYLHEFRDRMVRVPGISGVWIEASMFRPSEVESLKAAIVAEADRQKALDDEWGKTGIGGPKASVAKAMFNAPLGVDRIPAFTQYEHDLCEREAAAHPQFAGVTRSRGPNNTVILKVFEHPGHEGRIDSVWPDDTGIFDYIPSLARRAYAPPGYEVVESAWAHEARSAIIAWNNPDRVKASIKLPEGFSLVSDREKERLTILAREAEDLVPVPGTNGAVFVSKRFVEPKFLKQFLTLAPCFFEGAEIWIYHPKGVWPDNQAIATSISPDGMDHFRSEKSPSHDVFIELIASAYPGAQPSHSQDEALTADMIKNAIVSEEYHRYSETMTVCLLTMRNGFIVSGESACVSPKDFDEELGKKRSFEAAFREVRRLEGYALAERRRLNK